MMSFQSSQFPTSSLDTSQCDEAARSKASSEAELIRLTTTVIELLNARDFSNPWFYENVARDVRVDVQGHVKIGLSGFLGNYKADASVTTNFQVLIGNVTAMVDEMQGTGTAILSQYLSGYHSDERRMAGTILMSWARHRKSARWICRSVTMMLGTPVFLTNDIYGMP